MEVSRGNSIIWSTITRSRSSASRWVDHTRENFFRRIRRYQKLKYSKTPRSLINLTIVAFHALPTSFSLRSHARSSHCGPAAFTCRLRKAKFWSGEELTGTSRKLRYKWYQLNKIAECLQLPRYELLFRAEDSENWLIVYRIHSQSFIGDKIWSYGEAWPRWACLQCFRGGRIEPDDPGHIRQHHEVRTV